MGSYRCLCVLKGSYVFLWDFLVLFRFFWVKSLYGFLWVLEDSYGFLWVVVGFCVFLWILMGSYKLKDLQYVSNVTQIPVVLISAYVLGHFHFARTNYSLPSCVQ